MQEKKQNLSWFSLILYSIFFFLPDHNNFGYSNVSSENIFIYIKYLELDVVYIWLDLQQNKETPNNLGCQIKHFFTMSRSCILHSSNVIIYDKWQWASDLGVYANLVISLYIYTSFILGQWTPTKEYTLCLEMPKSLRWHFVVL